MSALGWKTETQPILTAVTASYDMGNRVIDPAEISGGLGLTPHQVVIALGKLVTTGFLEAEPADTGGYPVSINSSGTIVVHPPNGVWLSVWLGGEWEPLTPENDPRGRDHGRQQRCRHLRP